MRKLQIPLESFQQLTRMLRSVFPELEGTDAQLGALIADALETINPDTDAAELDAQRMARAFRYLASQSPGDMDYPDDPTINSPEIPGT